MYFLSKTKSYRAEFLHYLGNVLLKDKNTSQGGPTDVCQWKARAKSRGLGRVVHVSTSLADIPLCLGSWFFPNPFQFPLEKKPVFSIGCFFLIFSEASSSLPHHLPLLRHPQGPDISQSWLSRSASKFTLRSM